MLRSPQHATVTNGKPDPAGSAGPARHAPPRRFARRSGTVLLALALGCIAAPAGAQVALKLEGRCTKLVIAGEDLTASCKGVLTNTVTRNRTGFVFTTDGDRSVSFAGSGFQQEATEETDPLQPINLVIPAGPNGPQPPAVAVGACRFSTPEPGKTQIECEASVGGSEAPEATYAGTFVTDARAAPGAPAR